ncbi:MAG: hypothetical protein J3R72DRAFT_455142 [Linnemannia gamsii]|nr:MAG: hypothetical protein J3R72DRAFT_455142 [Linnemannia gamsii]
MDDHPEMSLLIIRSPIFIIYYYWLRLALGVIVVFVRVCVSVLSCPTNPNNAVLLLFLICLFVPFPSLRCSVMGGRKLTPTAGRHLCDALPHTHEL